MQKLRAPVVLIIAVVGIAAGCARLRVAMSDDDRAAVRTALQGELQKPNPGFVTRDKEGARLWKLTRAYYKKRDLAPAWLDDRQPRPQMDALIGALSAADREGLDPELYSVALLKARREEAGKGFLSKKGFAPAEAAALDAWLTFLYMKYASDLANGLSDLAHADPAWKIPPENFDPLANLEDALDKNRVAESLQALAPVSDQYRRLRDLLAEYRQAATKEPWPKVTASVKARPGQSGPHVTAIARRLAASGDYKGRVPADGPMTMDAGLTDAVKRFQRRHGLEDDGVVGAAVVAEMNVPIDARIRQIELNLERWRWLPRDLGKRHILVNIPAYRLDVWEGGRVPLTMRVVVGRKDTPTPIFSDRMTYLVFSPYWNVPPDIAKNETLPGIMKDTGFLERNNMEVLDKAGNPVDPATIDVEDPEQYRFRQRPGQDNSLGLIKFMFPNEFNVYFHDTPADSLFARATRSFSHGCVRLENPIALAEYVLRDQPEWTRTRIEEAMDALEEETVKLRDPIHVYLGYWTVDVDPDGGVRFVGDVYGVDERQGTRLKNRLGLLKTTAKAASLP